MIKYNFYVGLLQRNGCSVEYPVQTFERLTRHLFDAFTVFNARGYWKGIPEDALVFEIIVKDDFITYEAAKNLAKQIAKELNQEAVLVTRQRVVSELVYT